MGILDFMLTGYGGDPVPPTQPEFKHYKKLKQAQEMLDARADVADKAVATGGGTNEELPAFNTVTTPAPPTAGDMVPPLAPGQTVADANAPTPPPQVTAPQPAPLPTATRRRGSMYEVLSALGRGYNAGGLVSAIGDAGQVAEGGPDQGANETLAWLKKKGISDEGLAAAAKNPKIMNAMVGELVKPAKSSDPAAVKEYKFAMQQEILEANRLGTRPKIKSFTDWKRGNKTGGFTKGEEARDKAYGKEYVEFQAKGGFADAQKNIDQLAVVEDVLKKGKHNLTGAVIGQLSDRLMVFTDAGQRAVNMRELVEEVVQRNLRLVLGAQFTEREGERLIARAYNPKLDEPVNAARVGRLIKAMKDALKSKRAAADYFEKHGTLSGYKGPKQAEMEAAVLKTAGVDDLDTQFKSNGWGIKRAD